MNTHLRRFGALTVAAILTVGLAGCSKDNEQTPPTATKPTPSATASPSTPPSATPSPTPSTIVDPSNEDPDFCKQTKQAPFTGAAADTFGAANVMTAYCEFGNFGMVEGWTNLMETKDSYAPIEFSFVKPWMTAGMQKDWDGIVAKAVSGDKEAEANVRGLTGFKQEGPEYQFDAERPRAIKRTVSAATTSVGKDRSGSPAVIMVMTFKGDLVTKSAKTGKFFANTMTREVTFVVVPSGSPERPWLMDGYRSNINYEQSLRPIG